MRTVEARRLESRVWENRGRGTKTVPTRNMEASGEDRREREGNRRGTKAVPKRNLVARGENREEREGNRLGTKAVAKRILVDKTDEGETRMGDEGCGIEGDICVTDDVPHGDHNRTVSLGVGQELAKQETDESWTAD